MSGAPSHSFVWRIGPTRVLELDRPRVMGILNITPDSFSDGGVLVGVEQAARVGAEMIEHGADVLDVGGESTRPGAQRVDEREQIGRVCPVIRELRRGLGDDVPISIDTTLAGVARAALDAGANVVNDVSAGMDDPAMLALCASHGCGVVLMHRRVPPGQDVLSHDYRQAPSYADESGVVPAVAAFLGQRLAAARAAGMREESILLDPGLGFGKSVEQNLALLAGTRRILALGRPVLSGLSRKSFTAVAGGLDTKAPATTRVDASVGLSVAHLHAGASVFRVHDVRAHATALRAAWRVLVSATDGDSVAG